jgi:triacylglycerol lipase
MAMKILLAHGVLGFGVLGPFEYFNGIAHGLEKSFPGVKVATAQVNPIGSVAERAAHLAQQIVAVAGGEKIHIFAHSMGGLDTRFALSNNLSGAAAHVSRVVMIGTPHLGSQVADAIENGDPAALRELPLPVVAELRVNQRALHDLTTAVARQADLQMHDVPGVEYVHVAGDMTMHEAHASLAFRGVDAFFGVNTPNDGVVTVESATTRGGVRQKPIAVWPTDHAGLIGWNLDRPAPMRLPFDLPNPLADLTCVPRYEKLVR